MPVSWRAKCVARLIPEIPLDVPNARGSKRRMKGQRKRERIGHSMFDAMMEMKAAALLEYLVIE